MQVSVLVALTLLVLTASGFLIGRRKASMSASQSKLHSLPGYYGYYVALWTSVPALMVLAAYAIFGSFIVNTLTFSALEREAAPITRAYEDLLSRDAGYQHLTAELGSIEQNLTLTRSELSSRRTAEEDVSQALQRLNSLTAERNEALAAIARLEDELAQRTAARAPASEAGYRARAGFEFMRAPSERRELIIADVRALALGEGLASRTTPDLEAAANALRPYEMNLRWAAAGAVLTLALGGLGWARSRVRPRFRARNRVEGAISAFLLIASVIAVLTTVGIVFSLLLEAVRFFAAIDWRVHEFLFGLQWSPQVAIRSDQIGQSGAFGAVPLFAGTALITVIAMAVAVPVGLFAAIYLSEYASPRFRAVAKPILEILAGVPTVVYGFFALLTVGPALRDFALFLGYQNADSQSALAAGLVMGVMIIPFVSSLSDDVINAVPQTLRNGAYAMGATKSETVRDVVLPAALPGIMGAVLLAVSRAVGETMIVVMAAGQGANLTANPLESVTTITVQIVSLLTGDLEFDGAKTLSAFALGLVLFFMTLALNIVALRVVQRFRERYE